MSKRKSFLLRIDPQLWSELESWAVQDLRSVNGQVEFLLREAVMKRKKNQSLPGPDSAASPSPREENG